MGNGPPIGPPCLLAALSPLRSAHLLVRRKVVDLAPVVIIDLQPWGKQGRVSTRRHFRKASAVHGSIRAAGRHVDHCPAGCAYVGTPAGRHVHTRGAPPRAAGAGGLRRGAPFPGHHGMGGVIQSGAVSKRRCGGALTGAYTDLGFGELAPQRKVRPAKVAKLDALCALRSHPRLQCGWGWGWGWGWG